MSAASLTNSSDSYDLKPSCTIERLQMFLRDRATMSHEHKQQSTNDDSSTSYQINQCQNSKNSQSSSPSHSSRTVEASDSQNQNNPKFTTNDAEKLLAFIGHFRN